MFPPEETCMYLLPTCHHNTSVGLLSAIRPLDHKLCPISSFSFSSSSSPPPPSPLSPPPLLLLFSSFSFSFSSSSSFSSPPPPPPSLSPTFLLSENASLFYNHPFPPLSFIFPPPYYSGMVQCSLDIRKVFDDACLLTKMLLLTLQC